jgi:hypothetical protein
MDYRKQLYSFYKPYLKQVRDAIETGGVKAFVGINASGKTYLAGQIMSEQFKAEFIKEKPIHRILLDFKDKPSATLSQICQYWYTQTAKIFGIKGSIPDDFNDFSLANRMSAIVQNLRSDEKIVFILSDAHNIFHLPESFFTWLTYLKIYSYGKVSFIILSEPHILECKNQGVERFIQRFTDHKFLFLKPFDRKTTIADIQNQSRLLATDFSKYQSILIRYSKGFHGFIRTFCYLLQKNPHVTNIRALLKIATQDTLCHFWMKEVLDSLPSQSAVLLREIAIENRTYKDVHRNMYVRWLVDLGFLTTSGKLRYPYFLALLHGSYDRVSNEEHVFHIVKNELYIRNNHVNLPKEEFASFIHLFRNKGKLVTYEELGAVLWGSDENKFSLWAIYQIIKRLRKKLSIYCVHPRVIVSRRGLGYSLEGI